jgi:hypothetical protein
MKPGAFEGDLKFMGLQKNKPVIDSAMPRLRSELAAGQLDPMP